MCIVLRLWECSLDDAVLVVVCGYRDVILENVVV